MKLLIEKANSWLDLISEEDIVTAIEDIIDPEQLPTKEEAIRNLQGLSDEELAEYVALIKQELAASGHTVKEAAEDDKKINTMLDSLRHGAGKTISKAILGSILGLMMFAGTAGASEIKDLVHPKAEQTQSHTPNTDQEKQWGEERQAQADEFIKQKSLGAKMSSGEHTKEVKANVAKLQSHLNQLVHPKLIHGEDAINSKGADMTITLTNLTGHGAPSGKDTVGVDLGLDDNLVRMIKDVAGETGGIETVKNLTATATYNNILDNPQIKKQMSDSGVNFGDLERLIASHIDAIFN